MCGVCEDLSFLCGFTRVAKLFFFLGVLMSLWSFTFVDKNEGEQRSSCDWGRQSDLINSLLLLSTRSCYLKAKGICFCCPQKSDQIVPHEGWKGVAILFSCYSLHTHWLSHIHEGSTPLHNFLFFYFFLLHVTPPQIYKIILIQKLKMLVLDICKSLYVWSALLMYFLYNNKENINRVIKWSQLFISLKS